MSEPSRTITGCRDCPCATENHYCSLEESMVIGEMDAHPDCRLRLNPLTLRLDPKTKPAGRRILVGRDGRLRVGDETEADSGRTRAEVFNDLRDRMAIRCEKAVLVNCMHRCLACGFKATTRRTGILSHKEDCACIECLLVEATIGRKEEEKPC